MLQNSLDHEINLYSSLRASCVDLSRMDHDLETLRRLMREAEAEVATVAKSRAAALNAVARAQST